MHSDNRYQTISNQYQLTCIPLRDEYKQSFQACDWSVDKYQMISLVETDFLHISEQDQTPPVISGHSRFLPMSTFNNDNKSRA